MACIVIAACAPASLVDVQPPSDVVDPSVAATATGATQLYNNAAYNFSQVLGGNYIGYNAGAVFLLDVGMFTDELMRAGSLGLVTNAGMDERTTSSTAVASFTAHVLNRPRVQASQAREALRLYAPNAPLAWQGQLYAFEAFSIVWMAELYCSGMPLTAVSLSGVVAPTAGFTTQELLERAAALFDTAILVSGDSTRFVYLAKVGKGRALLDLGRFADAATAVQGVPTDFAYLTEHSSSAGFNRIGVNARAAQVVDGEGGNGLIWSTDPRTAVTTSPAQSGGMKVSGKYSRTSAGILDVTQSIQDNPVRAADGLEARLIEAEADLAAGGSNWLGILNTLRSTCVGGTACAPIPASATMPFPLTAGSLPPLADPGTVNARLDLLMKERAMWLFLTGHRQGDLRRLAHVYHRDPAGLWPTGTYVNNGFPPLVAAVSTTGTSYGNDVVWPLNDTRVPTETTTNPLYQGCFNTDP